MEKLKTFGKRAPDGAYEIPILGDIGFFGTNGEDLIRELRAVKPQEVKFIIYSPGGAVYDAIAVAGYIREQGITCYAEIYGVCASAATVFAALAGPKNTAIAPGSMFLVHMPYGGDQKAIDNAAAFLVDLYVSAYGWTKAEARKHMEAEDGKGVLWNVTEAKKLGVVSEIMAGAKVAARLNLNEMTNEENKTTEEVVNDAPVEQPVELEGTGRTVNLTIAQALAAVSKGLPITDEMIGDALKPEVEARMKAEADVKALSTEIETLKAQVSEKDQTIATAKEEVKNAMDLLTKAQEEIAALRKPIGEAPKADNPNPAVGAMPGTDDVPEHVKALRKLVRNADPLEVAAAKRNQPEAK